MKIPSEHTEFYTILQKMLVAKGYYKASQFSGESGAFGPVTKEGWYQLCNDTPNCAGNALDVPSPSGPDWLVNSMAEFIQDKKINIETANTKPAGFTDLDKRLATNRVASAVERNLKAKVSEEAKAKAAAILRARKRQPTKTPEGKTSGGKSDEFTSTKLTKK